MHRFSGMTTHKTTHPTTPRTTLCGPVPCANPAPHPSHPRQARRRRPTPPREHRRRSRVRSQRNPRESSTRRTPRRTRRATRTRRAPRTPTAVLILALLIAGCGEPASGPTKPKTYREQVNDCLTGLYQLDRDEHGNTLVSKRSGDRIANIVLFATEHEARRRYGQLVVEGAVGGRGVATWYPAADRKHRVVVTDCLTP